jgi:hypothetical protein
LAFNNITTHELSAVPLTIDDSELPRHQYFVTGIATQNTEYGKKLYNTEIYFSSIEQFSHIALKIYAQNY